MIDAASFATQAGLERRAVFPSIVQYRGEPDLLCQVKTPAELTRQIANGRQVLLEVVPAAQAVRAVCECVS